MRRTDKNPYVIDADIDSEETVLSRPALSSSLFLAPDLNKKSSPVDASFCSACGSHHVGDSFESNYLKNSFCVCIHSETNGFLQDEFLSTLRANTTMTCLNLSFNRLTDADILKLVPLISSSKSVWPSCLFFLI